MWTNYLKLGSLFGFLLLAGCYGEQIEWVHRSYWYYNNQSQDTLTIVGAIESQYSSSKNLIFTLLPGETKGILCETDGGEESDPEGLFFPLDSTEWQGRQTKMLIVNQKDSITLYTHSGRVMDKKNYVSEQLDKRIFRFTYTFTGENIKELLNQQ